MRRVVKLKKRAFKLFIGLVILTVITIVYYGFYFDHSDIDDTILETVRDCNTNLSLGNFIKRYPYILSCKHPYKTWNNEVAKKSSVYNYSKPADKSLHNLRITRALIFYFPIERIDYFRLEFFWLYRSWINMLRYEPPKWRTDLIFFTERNSKFFQKPESMFINLNCTFENLRKSDQDSPMCTLIDYKPIKKRKFWTKSKIFQREPKNYSFFFNFVDLFSPMPSKLDEFYKFIQESITNYNYVDSIMMAFDGFEYFQSAGYDFLVRSDMDVFLTPLFATWAPRYCNDFYVGRGGYSNTFNSKRFERIASNLGLSYARSNNLGSTWYSTPTQFRLASYLTLLGMAYLNNEEFAQPEKDQKLGTLMWPEWHYGVLLLYGQHLMLNHLIATDQMNVVKLENQLDYPSGNNESIFKMLHIHVFHGENLFSKFVFKTGKYDNLTTADIDDQKSNMVNWFALKMALEGRNSTRQQLQELLSNATASKI